MLNATFLSGHLRTDSDAVLLGNTRKGGSERFVRRASMIRLLGRPPKKMRPKVCQAPCVGRIRGSRTGLGRVPDGSRTGLGRARARGACALGPRGALFSRPRRFAAPRTAPKIPRGAPKVPQRGARSPQGGAKSPPGGRQKSPGGARSSPGARQNFPGAREDFPGARQKSPAGGARSPLGPPLGTFLRPPGRPRRTFFAASPHHPAENAARDATSDPCGPL